MGEGFDSVADMDDANLAMEIAFAEALIDYEDERSVGWLIHLYNERDKRGGA